MNRLIHTDCLLFDGYKPCAPHKATGRLCDGCADYKPADYRVLILKVGAAGEVIRNTPLLHKLRALSREQGKTHEMTWLTDYPDFIPKTFVKHVLAYNWKNTQLLLAQEYDLLLSLDKDQAVCALANQIQAREKRGFLLNPQGKIVPANPQAERKWQTGVCDDLMRENTKHYVEEIFEICGWEWAGEKYILEDYRVPEVSFGKKPGERVIGLNTGAGDIWPTRVWPEEKWRELIGMLQAKGYTVVLLGGPLEHEKNLALARATGVHYEGVKPFKEFVGLMSLCDLIVTSVTMALHIAIGLGKQVVLFNNIFNRHEFHLFGQGAVIEPGLKCTACYKRAFDGRCPVANCMQLIKPEAVFEKISEQAAQY